MDNAAVAVVVHFYVGIQQCNSYELSDGAIGYLVVLFGCWIRWSTKPDRPVGKQSKIGNRDTCVKSYF